MRDDIRIRGELEARNLFLDCLGATANPAAAARAAGRALSFFKRHRRDDPMFAEQWDAAMARGEFAVAVWELAAMYDHAPPDLQAQMLPIIVAALRRGIYVPHWRLELPKESDRA